VCVCVCVCVHICVCSRPFRLSPPTWTPSPTPALPQPRRRRRRQAVVAPSLGAPAKLASDELEQHGRCRLLRDRRQTRQGRTTKIEGGIERGLAWRHCPFFFGQAKATTTTTTTTTTNHCDGSLWRSLASPRRITTSTAGCVGTADRITEKASPPPREVYPPRPAVNRSQPSPAIDFRRSKPTDQASLFSSPARRQQQQQQQQQQHRF
jgi:hypothetical protein